MPIGYNFSLLAKLIWLHNIVLILWELPPVGWRGKSWMVLDMLSMAKCLDRMDCQFWGFLAQKKLYQQVLLVQGPLQEIKHLWPTSVSRDCWFRVSTKANTLSRPQHSSSYAETMGSGCVPPSRALPSHRAMPPTSNDWSRKTSAHVLCRPSLAITSAQWFSAHDLDLAGEQPLSPCTPCQAALDSSPGSSKWNRSSCQGFSRWWQC